MNRTNWLYKLAFININIDLSLHKIHKSHVYRTWVRSLSCNTSMVWCRLGSGSLVIKSFFVQTLSTRFGQGWSWGSGTILKLQFSQYFATDPWLRLWRLFLVEILKLGLVRILKFKFSRNADIGLRFWSCCFVGSTKMKSDQDSFENLWYDLKKLLW